MQKPKLSRKSNLLMGIIAILLASAFFCFPYAQVDIMKFFLPDLWFPEAYNIINRALGIAFYIIGIALLVFFVWLIEELFRKEKEDKEEISPDGIRALNESIDNLIAKLDKDGQSKEDKKDRHVTKCHLSFYSKRVGGRNGRETESQNNGSLRAGREVILSIPEDMLRLE